MYQDFCGLSEPPFELTPNPRYLYLTPRHREALCNLQYGLSASKGLTVIVGEAGTGKTTLLKAALGSDRCRKVRCVHLNNPALTRSEFVEILAHNFQLGSEAAHSKAVLLAELDRVLTERRARGEITGLVVDEAQSLSIELLEEIRLLANFETASEKLLPLVLVGQPELAERLEHPRLRQLKQRIALRCEITPLSVSETAQYIHTRVKMAGGVAFRLFTREAVVLIHEYSRGIPRAISVICDNALVSALALRRLPADQDIIEEVCRDFRLGKAGAARQAAEQHSHSTYALQQDDPSLQPSEATDERADLADARSGTPRRAFPWEVALNRVATGFRRG